jgi:hypothetical protein
MPELLVPITLDDMIVEVERELALRREWYPRLKANAGRNKRNAMDWQYDYLDIGECLSLG